MLAVFGDWRQLKGGQKQAAFDRVIEYEQFTDEVTWGSTVRLLVLGSLDLPKQRLETVSHLTGCYGLLLLSFKISKVFPAFLSCFLLLTCSISR